MSTPAKSPSKQKKAAPKKPASHPPFSEMISAAITALKERSGSSRQAIEKYIKGNYKVGDNVVSQLRMGLKRGIANGKLVHTKGVGASGSFKVAKEEKKPKEKPAAKKKPAAKPKKPAAKPKKPAAKKAAKKPKKPAAKKPAAKKPAVKKPAAKKPAKKPAAKKPAAKKAAKKPAAKKPAKKPATKKAAAKK